MKKIWVPKSYLEILQVNVLMTPPVKNRNPRSNSSYGPNSSPECSNASNATNSSTVSAITNSSSEDIASITDDAWLKELYMTDMYKSLKGHQTLCDVLKKQILNRNPRKEGIAFERKLNADGKYWKPEQYPKTSWVAAKGPLVDPSNLSGFTCESPHSSDESFDSNYKLFKN